MHMYMHAAGDVASIQGGAWFAKEQNKLPTTYDKDMKMAGSPTTDHEFMPLVHGKSGLTCRMMAKAYLRCMSFCSLNLSSMPCMKAGVIV